ncbi:pyridoxal phosphate-dependent decarboxylase family protein [Haladaptatus caseinilyticus]|uniref:pyridoxal phosphate-dependent decarboxylase family protein n=1 Tax=Haladaptatus caseinilyticus TaxID=2993314 RepID=UPI00224B3817|nr:aspartate aminotransferase family protein [Haladaptatus caseinilyticus]
MNELLESRRQSCSESLFLADEDGEDTYRNAMERTIDAVLDAFVREADPYSGASPESLRDQFERMELIPEEGDGVASALDATESVLRNSVNVSNSNCLAHLHCPPMIPGLAAEAMLSATNQSMDSWDQSPAATLLETRMIEELCEVFGYDDDGDGVFTSGGTQSNFMGLLLARDWFAKERFGTDVQRSGLPHRAKAMRIICSEEAHFTAEQAAAHLGLGENAVVTVESNDDREMCPDALDRTLAELDERELLPFALVGTAGTTDFGSIDPLSELADRADEHDLWFHVDAAYGGALAFSDRHRKSLSGIERADSLSVDFHKLFYQPISCGAFLLRDGSRYEYIVRNASYLNPEGDSAPNLVAKSVQTTRRFDALKPFVSFRALGRKGFGALVDETIALADDVAALLSDDPSFELVAEPTINAVVFRYRPVGTKASDERVSWLNEAIRESLLREGDAVVARTEVDGVTALKFTLLNPRTTLGDVADILDVIERRGDSLGAVSPEVGR